MRRNKVYVGAFVLVMGLLVFLEAQQEQPVNWNPSYAAPDKIPLGTYVLYEELEEAFSVQPVGIPPYEFLQNSDNHATYLFINNQLPFDEAELKSLLGWVESGNTAFLAAEFLAENLLDTLGLQMEVAVPESGISTRPVFTLTASQLHHDQTYMFDRETFYYTFTNLDTLQHQVLGTVRSYSETPTQAESHPNFIKLPFGSGQIFLHAAPQVFTNYFILHEDNHTYTEHALSYIPGNIPIFWDAYHKAGKVFNTSPLYILFETPALKWAYYTILAGSLLFIFFEGKRKQRSIPVINPPQNNSVKFAATIADMYLEQRDYKGIAQKSISFFYRFLQYKMGRESSMDADFIYQVSSRWEIPETEIKNLFKYLNDLQKKEEINERDLKDLNQKINKIKMRINGK